jgi:uncharacterized delta-60 repeat protein
VRRRLLVRPIARRDARSLSTARLDPRAEQAYGRPAQYLCGVTMKRSASGRRNDRRVVRARGQIAASVLAAWVILFPGSAHAAPGDLDPTFGDGGWAVTDVHDYLQTGDALLQPDGRIVVIASATGNEMAAWRLQSNGDPDPSFGGDGVATIAFGRTSGAWAAALQPDGKLVLVGYAGRRVAVARLMPNGDPDASFGVGGSTTIRLEEKAAGDDVAIASDGSIVVGASFVEGRHPYRYAIGTALLRLDPQGTPDATFGSQGIVSFGDRRLGDLALDDQDSIVVALLGPIYRFEQPTFFVTRRDADGMADPTFGGDGFHRYTLKHLNQPSHVVIDPDGRIILAVSGYSDRCLFGRGGVVRLTPDGVLDRSFSDDGVVLRRCMLVRRVAVADDGRILAGGSIWAGGGSGEYYPTLSRFNPTGQPDPSFGDQGNVISPPAEDYWSETRGILIQGDGKIVLLAGGVYPEGFGVGRFLAV